MRKVRVGPARDRKGVAFANFGEPVGYQEIIYSPESPGRGSAGAFDLGCGEKLPARFGGQPGRKDLSRGGLPIRRDEPWPGTTGKGCANIGRQFFTGISDSVAGTEISRYD